MKKLGQILTVLGFVSAVSYFFISRNDGQLIGSSSIDKVETAPGWSEQIKDSLKTSVKSDMDPQTLRFDPIQITESSEPVELRLVIEQLGVRKQNYLALNNARYRVFEKEQSEPVYELTRPFQKPEINTGVGTSASTMKVGAAKFGEGSLTSTFVIEKLKLSPGSYALEAQINRADLATSAFNARFEVRKGTQNPDKRILIALSLISVIGVAMVLASGDKINFVVKKR